VGVERVTAGVFNTVGDRPTMLKRLSGRGNMTKWFAFLEDLQAGGNAPLEEGIREFLRFHAGRGMAVILSDFLTFGDVKACLNRLYSVGLETFAVQILGPSELEPEVGGDVRLVDCETGGTLDVSPGELIAIYDEYRERFQHDLAQLCRQRSGRFVAISSEDSLDWVLFDLLRRRGWLR
jgi:hypothetical protein